MHGIVDREPATDDGAMFFRQQWVQLYVDFTNGIMGTVRVMVQHSETYHKMIEL